NEAGRVFIELVIENMVEPGFLTHGVDIDLLEVEAIDERRSLVDIASAGAARVVDVTGQRFREERTEDPGGRSAFALHAEEEDVGLAGLAEDVVVNCGVEVARVRDAQYRVVADANEVRILALDGQVV